MSLGEHRHEKKRRGKKYALMQVIGDSNRRAQHQARVRTRMKGKEEKGGKGGQAKQTNSNLQGRTS